MYTQVEQTNIEIRNALTRKYLDKDFVIDKTGNKVVELLGVSFRVTEDTIFRKPNNNYIGREIKWYDSESLNINLIDPPIPEIWKNVANSSGEINSNYGWCIYSPQNGSQFYNVVNELIKNPESRRAIMIYNRPSMHTDYKYNGKNDFICCQWVQYFIRDNKLSCVVSFRSNDAVYGFLNDFAWQNEILGRVYLKLHDDPSNKFDNLKCGEMIWQAGSFHLYERHFPLIEKYISTGEYR